MFKASVNGHYKANHRASQIPARVWSKAKKGRQEDKKTDDGGN